MIESVLVVFILILSISNNAVRVDFFLSIEARSVCIVGRGL